MPCATFGGDEAFDGAPFVPIGEIETRLAKWNKSRDECFPRIAGSAEGYEKTLFITY
jgi:hypothetical protein